MRVTEALREQEGLSRVDAELIVAAILRRTRTWVIAHDDAVLTPAQIRAMRSAFLRRRRGEPLAYILESREFCGRLFRVTRDVLIPRPATEGLVEFAAEILRSGKKAFAVRPLDSGIVGVAWIWKRPGSCAIADIGTGSGCIAVTMEKLFPRRRIIATDISAQALNVAKRNASLLEARVAFRRGRSLRPFAAERKPFVVISNPPYIPLTMRLQKDVEEFEPRIALRGGKKGTDVIEEIMEQARAHPRCVGIVIECRTDQAAAIRSMVRAPDARPT